MHICWQELILCSNPFCRVQITSTQLPVSLCSLFHTLSVWRSYSRLLSLSPLSFYVSQSLPSPFSLSMSPTLPFLPLSPLSSLFFLFLLFHPLSCFSFVLAFYCCNGLSDKLTSERNIIMTLQNLLDNNNNDTKKCLFQNKIKLCTTTNRQQFFDHLLF